MADANRSQLAYAVETTWGTTPTAAFTKLRFTGESLGFNIANITSNEIRDDRQISDLIQTGADCSGGINFELSYGTFDDIFEGVFMSDWVGVGGTTDEDVASTGTVNQTIVLNGTNNTITFGSALTIDIVKGQWIEIAVAGTNPSYIADNGYHFVTNVSGQVVTVTNLTGPVAGDANPVVHIKGARLRNGVTEKYFSIERRVDKASGDDYYFVFRGMMPNTMNLTATASAIVTGSFDFIGKDSAVATSSYASTSTYTEAPTNDVMNAVADVGEIMEGASLTLLSGIYIQELSFTLNNNLRGLQAIGNLGNVDVGAGRINVTGTMNVYFENKSLYEKYVAATESGISFKIEDSLTEGSGNCYIFTFPRVKFATDTINAEGIDTDIMERMTWQAIRHATYGCTAQVCRFPA